MNLRQLKRRTQARMHHIIWRSRWQRSIDRCVAKFDEMLALPDPELEKLMDSMFPGQLGVVIDSSGSMQDAPKTWKVTRAKDGVVVLEAKTEAEALEAIDKASRQKKAKLVCLDLKPMPVA